MATDEEVDAFLKDAKLDKGRQKADLEKAIAGCDARLAELAHGISVQHKPDVKKGLRDEVKEHLDRKKALQAKLKELSA